VNRTAVALLLLAAAPALAQQAPATPDLAGRYRLSGPTAAGRVDLVPDGQGYRYEREVAGRLEQGRAVVRGGSLLLQSDETTGLAALGFGAAPPPARMRYLLPSLDGARKDGAGVVTRERLDPWRDATDGNAVELLVDGDAFTRMRQAIDAAREEIDVQTFQWGDDATGRGIARQLMEKARQGVRVRCLVDASSKTVNDLIKRKDITAGLDDELRAAGVEVIVAHGYAAGVGASILNMGRSLWDGVRRLFGGSPPARERRGLWNHDHRKILIVDRRVSFVGGMNIAYEYEHDWHDVVARVEGPTAFAVHALFVDRWNAACGKHDRKAPVGAAPRFERPPGALRVEALGSVPGVTACIRDLYLREIEAARSRVLIEVAYFLDDRIIDALARAVRRGVRVVVVIPSDEKNDVYVVKEAFAWVEADVIRSGVELYHYQPCLVHAKLGVFDGREATIGSSNLDRVALDTIAEANVLVEDPSFAAEVERRIFAVDLPRSVRAQPKPLPWRRKLTSGALHFFRGLL
jgi:cardiolipin synthase